MKTNVLCISFLLAMLAVTGVTAIDQHYEVTLRWDSGNISVVSINVKPTFTNFSIADESDYEARLLDDQGNELFLQKFSFMTQFLYDAYELNQSGNLYGPASPEATVVVLMPYIADAQHLDIIDANGTRMLEIDLSPYNGFTSEPVAVSPSAIPISQEAAPTIIDQETPTGLQSYVVFGTLGVVVLIFAIILFRKRRKEIQRN